MRCAWMLEELSGPEIRFFFFEQYNKYRKFPVPCDAYFSLSLFPPFSLPPSLPPFEQKMSAASDKIDEKLDQMEVGGGDIEKRSIESTTDEREKGLEHGTNFLDRIGLRMKAEIRGVERVPEEKREKQSWLLPLTMFLSPNMSIAALSTGMLGPTFYGLDFTTCILIIVFWSIIGALPVGFFAVFGAKTGLRQQILSRFFTGNIMGRVFAFFNVVSCIGWNAVNVLPSVQMLAAMGPLPPWAGCLILVVITCVVAFFGYKAIHIYERWAWVPNFAVYLVIIARLAMSHKFVWGEMSSGPREAGNVLTFISSIFGFTAGWAPSSADYFVYMPSDTPLWQIFMAMVVGLSVPCMFTCILGAACAMGTLTDDGWAQAFDKNSVGGLLNEILNKNNLHGFGKFCMVVLALSSIANNLPGSYSLSLSVQAIWSPLARFPRLAWCVIGNFVSLALSIPAYYVFSQTMSNFLSIIGYNVAIYLGIAATEHFIYRKGFDGYDVTNYNDRKTIPVGYAGVCGFLFGVASTILSMNQTWYHGVIARRLGQDGGDISFELNIAFAFVGYNLVRPFELKYCGR